MKKKIDDMKVRAMSRAKSREFLDLGIKGMLFESMGNYDFSYSH
jgi:hypothetical protein